MCDVTHAASVLLCEGGARRLFPAEDCLALLLAALCHDAEHPGTTNAFLARTDDPKVRQRPSACMRTHHGSPSSVLCSCSAQVALYGSSSTLERHHATVATTLLRAQRQLLGGLSAAQAERVETLIPLLIGATDIERHGVHMAAFAAHWGDGAAEAAVAADGTLADVAARDALLAVLLKAADVSNAAKPWPLAVRWAGLLKAEHLLLGASFAVRIC